jgi:hypothetical protein
VSLGLLDVRFIWWKKPSGLVVALCSSAEFVTWFARLWHSSTVSYWRALVVSCCQSHILSCKCQVSLLHKGMYWWRGYLRHGIVVWLNVPLDALAKRVTAVGTESRPLLPPDAAQHQVCFLRPLILGMSTIWFWQCAPWNIFSALRKVCRMYWSQELIVRQPFVESW